jgi:5'-3' exonuclease|tara:strand:+ start:484 stop:1485 length:1002 start_codon:yes stop_codon:yes gene_type:complete
MAVFILDGGLFVGRFERNKFNKSKSYWWWKRQLQAGEVSTKDFKEGIKKAFSKDIHHFKFKMGLMGELDKVIVCYDGIYGRRLRGKLHNNYKSHKSGIKASKHKGIDVREVIAECGYNPMNLEPNWQGYYEEYKEADDLIAEKVQLHSALGDEIVIMSEDKDMLQMLSWEGNIRVHNLKQEITAESFTEDWGIAPHQYVDWKCLVGDVSDNIKGLHGWGAKKATNMLRKYGSISNFPKEHKVSFKARDLYKISKKMKAYRDENEYSLNYCNKKITTCWKSLEQMTRKTPLTFSEIHKINKLIPNIIGLFDKLDNTSQALIWKKIIQLPFDSNR